MKLKNCRQIFQKYSNIKFNKNPSIGRWVVPCGGTYRYDEANNRFLQFCEGAQKLRCYMNLSACVMQQYVSPFIIKMDYLIATIRELHPGRLCNLDLFWKNLLSVRIQGKCDFRDRSTATRRHTVGWKDYLWKVWLKAGIVKISLWILRGPSLLFNTLRTGDADLRF